MPESIIIPNIGTITYTNATFKIENNTLDITLEIDGNASESANTRTNDESDPFEGKNIPIRFQWNNETVCATIFCIQSVYTVKEGENIRTHLVLKLIDIHGSTDFSEFERITFFIPDIQCHHVQAARNLASRWSICKSEITFSEKKWIFMDAYNSGHNYPIPYEMSDNGNQGCGTLIETAPNQFSGFSEIKKHVFNLCTMFGFAMGKAHMWVSAWGIKGNDVYFISASGHEFNHSNTPNAIIYYGDDKHRCGLSPVGFVSEVCNEFADNAEWWQITLNWIINENSSHTIEVTKLVEFVLLDRVTSKIFAIIAKIALNLDLGKYTINSKIRKFIGKPLETKIKKFNTKKLTAEERDFVTMCLTWAQSPSYMTKLKAICAFAGLLLTPKEEQQIEERNNLVHQGRLQLAINHVMNYATETTSFTRALILAALGYNGYFASYSERPAVTEVFPNAERIKLTNIETLARKIFI